MSTTPANRIEAAKPASGSKVLFDPDLRALLDRPPLPQETFLSLYLDASVDAQGKRHVEDFLDKRAKAARERLARLPVDLKGYDALIERVRAYADESDKSGVQGIAVFAEIPPSEGGGEAPFFRAFRLPVRVENRFILAGAPDLGPVLRAVGGYAHYLAVRLDADDARILSVYLGRAVRGESDRAEGGDETVQGRIRSHPGGWSQMRVQRRKEEHVQRWYRDLARNLQQIAERERADGIVLLGQDVNLAAFKEELPEPVAAKVIRTDTIEPHSTDADIVARVEPLVEWAGHEARSRLVDELHDRVYRDWYAVGGIEDTLEALQQGRVERLLVSRRFDAKGKRCEKCGFLVSARHEACPYCGGRLAEVALLQQMVERAESQEARVEFIDDPEPRLDDLEGVGALLRIFESDAIAEARQAEARGEAR